MRKDENIIATLLSGKADKKYEGKEVVVCDGKVYILPEDDEEAKKFFNQLIAQHPNITPTLTFVPKHNTYIL